MSRCSTNTKARLRSHKHTQQKEAKNLQNQLPRTLQRSMELSQEKGASTWLIPHLPVCLTQVCIQGCSLPPIWLVTPESTLRLTAPIVMNPFSIEHALNSKTGGFPAVRHNEVCDITASLLSEVCHKVTIEPHLQPLTDSEEVMSYNSAITDDGARLDVAMYGFWGVHFEKAFVDIKVFNPCAQSNRRSPISFIYR